MSLLSDSDDITKIFFFPKWDKGIQIEGERQPLLAWRSMVSLTYKMVSLEKNTSYLFHFSSLKAWERGGGTKAGSGTRVSIPRLSEQSSAVEWHGSKSCDLKHWLCLGKLGFRMCINKAPSITSVILLGCWSWGAVSGQGVGLNTAKSKQGAVWSKCSTCSFSLLSDVIKKLR